MKLIYFVFISMLISSGSIFSQDFYVKLHSGYGIGTSTQNVYDYSRIEGTQGAYTIDQKAKSYSFGNGMYYSANFGYFINPNIGFDLELQYLGGASVSYKNYYSLAAGKETDSFENSGSAYMISPSVLLRTNISLFKPYLKLGPVFSFASITNKINFDLLDNNNTRILASQELLKDGGMAIGLKAALGVSYEILKGTDIFFELSDINISYAPEKGETKKFIVNGVDQLSRTNANFKQINYDESMHFSTSETDPNKPASQAKTDYPFSSLIFSFGFSYNF